MPSRRPKTRSQRHDYSYRWHEHDDMSRSKLHKQESERDLFISVLTAVILLLGLIIIIKDFG